MQRSQGADRANASQAALRHLLRHLWDRPGPATDALVAKVTAAARLLAAEPMFPGFRVSDIAGRRQREIVLKCDIGRRPQKEVAAELGISRSQFYVERRRAIHRLCVLLGTEAPQPVDVVAAQGAEFEVRLRSARALAQAGHLGLARRALRTVGGEACEQSRACAAIAELYVECGNLEAARHSLAQAIEAAQQAASAKTPHWRLASAEAELASSVMSWHRGDVREAMAAAYRSIDTLQPAQERASSGVLEALVRALAQAAACHRCVGSHEQALALLTEASLLLIHDAEMPVELRVDLLLSRADTLLLTRQPLVVSQSAAYQAYTLARRHGLVRKTADAASELCVIALMLEDYDAAAAFGHQSIRLAGRNGGREQQVLQHLNTARAEALRGQLQRAAPLFAAARLQAQWSSMLISFCDLHEVEALILGRRYHEAVALADRVRKQMELHGAQRFIGASWLLQSQALEPIGDIRQAKSAAGMAVTILERYGSAVSLARAYAVSGRLTRNRRHKATARELFSAARAGTTPLNSPARKRQDTVGA